ncbi:hypothetical protein GCM10009557_63600 [Virgisporangium ochraceum]|uniref:DUF998 domain-containing protein n=1 Tax=Virgisporangium ochraceum TaxID=65505 RepID=A0A8J4EFC1_9ACTN|nr:DUF998 domain-containing protein [Virgisporangium ochraceum]GIJ72654.1 hypothetical protein Voc01_075710 [Virgisporangium ochraceum]
MTFTQAAPVSRPTSKPGLPHLLALGAVVGPVLFTVSWLVLGAVSDGYTLFGHTFRDYSPVSQPISGLGMGDTAPYMNTAFVLCGLLLVVGVVGVMRVTSGGRVTTALLALTGVGQAMCGIFTLEAMMPHSLGFMLALGTPAVSFLLAGRHFRRVPGWERLGTGLFVAAPVSLALFVAFFMTFQPTADGAEHGVAGLVQRAGAVEVFAWFVAMGWMAFRHR